MDFEINSDDSKLDSFPYILFINNADTSSEKNFIFPIGIQTYGLNWVEVKYEFFESKTTKPVNVKGYTSYWNLESWQGIHFVDNNTGFYSSDSSKLYYTTVNSSPYIYANMVDRLDVQSYSKSYSITETFEGTNMTRVYSFAAGEDDIIVSSSDRTITHSPIVPYGLKGYARDTSSGADGSEVKVGDKIRYEVQVLNDSLAASIMPSANYNTGNYSTLPLATPEGSSDDKVVSKLSINDDLSKGLKYVPGSSKLVIKSFTRANDASIGDPVITDSDNGTILNWNDISLGKGFVAILIYEVEVTSDASKEVSNGASAVLTNECFTGDIDIKDPSKLANFVNLGNDECVKEKKLTLNKLVNPLYVEKQEEKPNPKPGRKTPQGKTINVPDTASVVGLIDIIIGISLIGSGSYVLFRKYM